MPDKPNVTTGSAPKEPRKVDHQSEEFLARAIKAEKERAEYAKEAGDLRQELALLKHGKYYADDALKCALGMLADVLTAYGLTGYRIRQEDAHVTIETGEGADDELDWDAFVEALEVFIGRGRGVGDPGEPDPSIAPILGAVGEAIGYLSSIIQALGLYDGFFLRATSEELVMRDRNESRLDLRAVIDKEVVPAVLRDRDRRAELENRGNPDLLTPLGVSRQLLQFNETIEWLRGALTGLDHRVGELEKTQTEQGLDLDKVHRRLHNWEAPKNAEEKE